MHYLRIAFFVIGGILLLASGIFYWLYRFFENEKKNKDKIKKMLKLNPKKIGKYFLKDEKN